MSKFLETNESQKYILLKKIGSGCSCQVYTGYDSADESQKLYAIKIFEQNTEIFYEKEIAIYEYLSSKFTLEIYNHGTGFISSEKNSEKFSSDNKKLINYIILELAENGELFDYLYFTKKPFDEKIACKIFYSIVKIIEYLHKKNIAHCDIKPENILVNNKFELKIIDFSFSHLLKDKTELINSYQGTKQYCSPESLKHGLSYDPFKHDIFSLGIVLFILAMGSFPFFSTSFNDKYYRYIVLKRYNSFWSYHKKDISDEFKDLFIKLVQFDPKERIGIEEIMVHPWIKKYNGLNIEDNGVDSDIVEELSFRKEEIENKKKEE